MLRADLPSHVLVACGSQLHGKSEQAKPCQHSPGCAALCRGRCPPASGRVGDSTVIMLVMSCSFLCISTAPSQADVISHLLGVMKGLLLGFDRQERIISLGACSKEVVICQLDWVIVVGSFQLNYSVLLGSGAQDLTVAVGKMSLFSHCFRSQTNKG